MTALNGTGYRRKSRMRAGNSCVTRAFGGNHESGSVRRPISRSDGSSSRKIRISDCDPSSAYGKLHEVSQLAEW
jgi:hypothetical protein